MRIPFSSGFVSAVDVALRQKRDQDRLARRKRLTPRRTDENQFYHRPVDYEQFDQTLRLDEKGVGTLTYDTGSGSTVVSKKA